MKKIYFASVALVAAALTSCIQEQSFNDVKLGENDVVFTFQGAAPTKAAEAPVRQGISVSLGNAETPCISKKRSPTLTLSPRPLRAPRPTRRMSEPSTRTI